MSLLLIFPFSWSMWSWKVTVCASHWFYYCSYTVIPIFITCMTLGNAHSIGAKMAWPKIGRMCCVAWRRLSIAGESQIVSLQPGKGQFHLPIPMPIQVQRNKSSSATVQCNESVPVQFNSSAVQFYFSSCLIFILKTKSASKCSINRIWWIRQSAS